MKYNLATALGIAAAVLATAPLPATTTSDGTYGTYDETYGDEYQSGDFARLTWVENGVTIVRGHGDPTGGVDEGSLNTPVFAGDVLRTAPDQRIEIQLAGGSLLRLDRAGELRAQALPDPYAEFVDNTVLALTEGTLQVVASLRGEETFRIDTADASVYLLGSGEFRIEAGRGRGTRVYSRQGVAEIAGDRGSVLVRAGQASAIWAGGYPEDPAPFNTLAADAFDRWTDERDRAGQVEQRRYGSSGGYDDDDVYGAIPAETRPYYRELSAHGDWVYVDDYGWSWYPTGVASGWRPYVYGSWSYGPHGYFWVSNEPWGWAPYHYGRWSWVSGYGWVWTPGRVFAGAWVAWSWGSVYVGWSPLDYWNYPVYYGDVYWGRYCRSWTFVRYDHIHVRDYHRYAVPVDRIGDDLDGRAISTRPPNVTPRDLRTDLSARREAARQVRDARPALDRRLRDGTTAGARTAADRTRFRDIEDRLVRRGARADRVLDLERGTPERATRQVREREQRGSATEARAGVARSTPAVRETSPPVRPRQIRSDAGRADDDRVRDLYRRIQRPTSPDDRGDTRATPAPSSARDRRVSPPSRPSTGDRTPDRGRTVRPQRRDDDARAPARVAPAPSRPSRPETARPSAPRTSPTRVAPRRDPDRGSPSTTRPAPSRVQRPSAPSRVERPSAPSRGTSARPSSDRSAGGKGSDGKSSAGKSSSGKSSGGGSSRSSGRSARDRDR